MSRNGAEGALLFLYTETPLHVGAGRGLGAIDLPIARERFSRLPVVPGSGLKGALREEAALRRGPRDPELLGLFGPEAPDDKTGAGNVLDFAGALSLSDARLLFLPIRSARSAWVWATAPVALERLARDLELLGRRLPPTVAAPAEGEARHGTASTVPVRGNLILEDLAIPATASKEVDALARWLSAALPQTAAYAPYRARLGSQLAVVDDTTFTDLSEQATELQTRVRLDPERRTVVNGALWTEEALPPESLLWSVIRVGTDRSETRTGPLFGKFKALFGFEEKSKDPLHRMRLGGDLGTGRGQCGVRLYAGEAP